VTSSEWTKTIYGSFVAASLLMHYSRLTNVVEVVDIRRFNGCFVQARDAAAYDAICEISLSCSDFRLKIIVRGTDLLLFSDWF